MSQVFYQELEHTADWTARVWGADLGALFEHAAAAMFELQGADLAAAPAPGLAAAVEVNAPDMESLLVAWLNELLFLSEMNDALYTRFHVQIEAGEGEFALTGQIAGLPGRGPLAHIKAVTYWDLAVEQTERGWEATVTFDT